MRTSLPASRAFGTLLLFAFLIFAVEETWSQGTSGTTLTLTANQTLFAPGDTLRVGLQARNIGPAFSANVYVGILLPDGITAVFITSFAPLSTSVARLDADPRTFPTLYANIPIPPNLDATLNDVFVYTLAGNETPGMYLAFAALVPPATIADGRLDAGDVVASAQRAVFVPCRPGSALPQALLTCRNWITFEPPQPFNPDAGVAATEEQLNRALAELAAEGWRGLVTYSLDPAQGLDMVPRIAKQNGFTSVIAGLFIFDEAQFRRERTAALAQIAFVDGFVLGNEVLQRGVPGFTRQRLASEIALLKQGTGRPVTTSESINMYEADPALALVGDWVFPTIEPFLGGIRSTAQAAVDVQNKVGFLQSIAPGRPVVVKEAWWPAGGGDAAATESNQVDFFIRLAASPVNFVFGEAYDQFWKTAEGPQGPHWGFHTSTSLPKALIPYMQSIYTRAY